MRRALVVAHGDDESLFFGGLVIAEPGDWTIFACSIPRVDPIRAWKFFDACEVLGTKARLLPFTESEPGKPLANLEALDLSGFDEVVTHNVQGEYGHVQHSALHRHVVARASGRVIAGCYGGAEGSKRVALSDDQWRRKLAALKCYDHVSPTDSKPKWQALLDRYSSMFDLRVETYEHVVSP